MQKKSFVDIFVVSAGNGLNAILGILFFTAVARSLPLMDFGKYALLTSLLVSISKIMDFGTNSVFVAEVVTHGKSYINKLFSIKIIFLLIAILISIPLLVLLHLFDIKILSIFVLGLLGYGINILLFAYFQSMQKFYQAVSLNFIPASIKAIFATLIFLGFMRIDLYSAFLIFAGSILSSTFLIVFLDNEYRNLKFEFVGIKNIFYEALPAGISQITKESWSAIGNVIVKITNTFSEVGIYSLAGKIADVFSLVSLSIFTVLLPKNAKRKSLNVSYNYKETAIISLVIILLAIIASIATNFLIEPIFGNKFNDSLSIVHILIFASAISAIHNFMDNFFFVEKQTKNLMNITLIKLICFIFLGAILSYKYSLVGLAIANLLSALVALTLTTRFLFKSK